VSGSERKQVQAQIECLTTLNHFVVCRRIVPEISVACISMIQSSVTSPPVTS